MPNNIIDLTLTDIHGNKTNLKMPIQILRNKKMKVKLNQNYSEVKVFIDPSQKLSSNELVDRENMFKAQYAGILEQKKMSVDVRVRKEIVHNFLTSLAKDTHHMLLTWTFHKKYGWHEDKVLNDVFAIRSRIIKLFFPNFKPYLNNRPAGFPKMYFFREKHSDGQYHIHLLMETIEPTLMAICLDREGFKKRWNTIIGKINKRKEDQQRVISFKMIQRWPDYKKHPYSDVRFSQIKSDYDEWKVARFICDYITHYRDGQHWGLNHVSNSPENNHSKVIESDSEIVSKSNYFNKDIYFTEKGEDFLRHIIPEYSDF